jgi:hypothetical protein
MAAVDLVCLAAALFASARDVTWIYYQYFPPNSTQITVDVVTYTAAFITALDRVARVMLGNIMNQRGRAGLHGKALQHYAAFLDGNGPTAFVNVQSNKELLHILPPDFRKSKLLFYMDAL